MLCKIFLRSSDTLGTFRVPLVLNLKRSCNLPRSQTEKCCFNSPFRDRSFNLKKREVSANDKRTMHGTLPTFKLKRLLCISHGLESPDSCCSKTNKMASRPQSEDDMRSLGSTDAYVQSPHFLCSQL